MIFQIPPANSSGKDYTAYWENFLTPDEVNLLLAQPEWLNTKDGCVGGSSGENTLNKDTRTTQLAWLGTKPELIDIWAKFAHATAEINRNFFRFDLTGFYEPMQLGLYSAHDSGHYDWHIDAAPQDKSVPRKLSIAMLLSDPAEFEGGEFQVKTCSDQISTLETRKGRAWFFPSYTLHRVTPVTKGVRRSLVLWSGGPEFR